MMVMMVVVVAVVALLLLVLLVTAISGRHPVARDWNALCFVLLFVAGADRKGVRWR